MDILRSRQNPLIKQLIKLVDSRRERLKQGQSLLLGTHLIDAALSAKCSLGRLLICEGEQQHPEIAALVQRSGQSPLLLARELFAEIEQGPSTVGVMALMEIPPAPAPARQGFCLLLEGVQDPGNVGSILRSAAAAGVDQVWLTTGCADAWAPKVLRAGMGAHFLVPLLERVGLEILEGFKGDIAVTTLTDATSLYQSTLGDSIVMAFGNEGAGVSADLLARATHRLHIPMARSIESLNVAAAVAICAFERRRQQLQR